MSLPLRYGISGVPPGRARWPSAGAVEYAIHPSTRCSVVDSAAVGRGMFGALPALLRQNRRLRTTLDGLKAKGRREGLTEEQLRAVLALARKSHRTAVLTNHYEQLRGLLGAWRFFHRILAIAMVALAIVSANCR